MGDPARVAAQYLETLTQKSAYHIRKEQYAKICPVTVMIRWISRLIARNRASTAAQNACRVQTQEPILGSWICADETDRFVVRVFCGNRPPSDLMLPPWRECLIFAVNKDTGSVEQIVDEKYQPILR